MANAAFDDATPHAAIADPGHGSATHAAPAGQDSAPHAAGPGAVETAGMRIIPFATSHDAAASFGFRIEDAADGDAVGYLTDSGIVTAQAHAALRDVRILALESNHDPKMLAAGPYPYVIKQRIASNSGHLVQRPGSRRARHAGGRIAHRGPAPAANGGGHARVAEQQRLQLGQTHARGGARRSRLLRGNPLRLPSPPHHRPLTTARRLGRFGDVALTVRIPRMRNIETKRSPQAPIVKRLTKRPARRTFR